MKVSFMYCSLLILLALTTVSYSQEYEVEGNSMITIIEMNGKSKTQIHSLLASAIANMYNSANDVIQMNDSDAGKIVVKGASVINNPSPMKAMFPKNKYIPEFIEIYTTHTINLDSKDGKFRVVYTYTDSYSNQVASQNNLGGKIPTGYGYSLEKPSSEMLSNYAEELINAPGMGFYGKKKKNAYDVAIKEAWISYVEELNSNAKATITSIKNAVIKGAKDDW